MVGLCEMVLRCHRLWYFLRTIQTIQTSPKASSLFSLNMVTINSSCMGNVNPNGRMMQLSVVTSRFWSSSPIFKHRNHLFKKPLRMQATFVSFCPSFTVNLISLSSSGKVSGNTFERTVVGHWRCSKRISHWLCNQCNCPLFVYGSITHIAG